MAKKKTAAAPARATAKKPAAPPARGTAKEQEVRRALLRVVTRQLECARLGLIGAPEYWLAFADDLQVARHFCERLKILNPLPFLIEDGEIEGISSTWIVPAPPRVFQRRTASVSAYKIGNYVHSGTSGNNEVQHSSKAGPVAQRPRAVDS